MTDEQWNIYIENEGLVYKFIKDKFIKDDIMIDIIKDSLIEAILKHDSKYSKLSTFFFLIARNNFINEVLRRKHGALLLQSFDIEEFESSSNGKITEVREILLHNGGAHYVDVMRLVYEGYNQTEIARVTGYSQSKVSRIIKKSKEIVREEFIHDGNPILY